MSTNAYFSNGEVIVEEESGVPYVAMRFLQNLDPDANRKAIHHPKIPDDPEFTIPKIKSLVITDTKIGFRTSRVVDRYAYLTDESGAPVRDENGQTQFDTTKPIFSTNHQQYPWRWRHRMFDRAVRL